MSAFNLSPLAPQRPALAWRVLGWVAHAGYGLGCRYPSLMVHLRLSTLSAVRRDGLWRVVQRACPELISTELVIDRNDLDERRGLEWLLSVWWHAQQAQGLLVFESGRVINLRDQEARCLVAVGAQAHRSMAELVVATLNWLQAYEPGPDDQAVLPASERLTRAVQSLRAYAAHGSNVPRFVRAAHGLHIPTMALSGGVIQYGLGRQARWLDSSFTDQTPTIAAKLARNKVWAAKLLAQAGLPVPEHLAVNSGDEAVVAAQRLGYPVVVKPANLDGGLGVAAGLECDEEVRQAFAKARQHSAQILVEKHVFGKDYRLTVFQDEVIWSIERVPAGVWGDGRSTVAELVQVVNADPKRGEGVHAPLKRLVLDDEALALLLKQGADAQTVLQQGQFLRLRRTANVASGGQPVAVHERVHPDNARLAVRAAQALGLDVAGIDLLIEDVSRSWRDCGSNVAICEVNGQPNLGQTTAAHLYGQILGKLVKGRGRVPCVLILGAAAPEVWLSAFEAAFQAQGLCVGLSGPQGVSLGGEVLSKGFVPLHAAGVMLALNRQVDAMVMAITENSLHQTGLPWPRYDALVLAGKQLPAMAQADGRDVHDALSRWLERLLPACDGMAMAHEDVGVKVSGVARVTSARWFTGAGSAQDVAMQVVNSGPLSV